MPTSEPNAQHPISVSIIIVSWNAREYLLQCLATLTPAVCRYPMEIIVVDNASTDGSPESVASTYPDVRLICNRKNLGFAKANNLGIAASTGSYICLVNSDVSVLPDCINRLVDYCDRHAMVGICGPRIIGGDGKLQRSCRGIPTLWNLFCRALALDALFPRLSLFTGYKLTYWAQDSLRPVGILTGCFWLVPRRALDDVGLLDEDFFMYGEDVDWCQRFWKHGWQVLFNPAAEAIHYGGASSANAPVRFFIEKHRANLQYWKKHHARASLACFFLLLCLHNGLRVFGHAFDYGLRSQERKNAAAKIGRSVHCLKWLVTHGFGYVI